MTTPTTVSVRLQLRADTAANWTSANPTLLANELGRETDTGKIKIGNGSTAWSSLAYQAWATLPIAVASGGTGQTSYTNGQLLIGNTTGNTLTKATLTAGSGIAITNGTGSITVAASGISDAQIAADAEIAVSKLADGTARQLLQTDAAGTGVEWASNIDIPGTLDVTSAATFDSTIGASAGTASLPSITFTGDLNTGIYSPGADQVSFTTGGTERLRIDSTGQIEAVSLGTAAAPTYSFTTDANTGIYSPGADQVAISTGGTGRITIDGSGNVNIDSNTLYVDATNNRVGIGTTAPAGALNVQSSASDTWSGEGNGLVINGGNAGNAISTITTFYDDSSIRIGSGVSQKTGILITGQTSGSGSTIQLRTGNSERARIDSSGRLLVGTSSARANFFNTIVSPQFQIEGSGDFDRQAAIISSSSTAAFGAVQILAHQKSGAIGGNTLVASGDSIGLTSFQGSDGTQFVEAARIEAFVDGTPGADDMPGRLVFSTTADGASSPTERMRITNDGRIRMNTVNAVNTEILTVENSGDNYVANFKGGSAAQYTVGVWNPGTSGNNLFAVFSTEAVLTVRGSITYNRAGGLTAYNTTSDYRAKTLLGEIDNPGKTIDALKIYRGVMNGATVERPMLVAHEAQEVAPYCVTGEKDAVDDDGNPIYQQMDHQALVPLLIAEIQQLRARVAALEAA